MQISNFPLSSFFAVLLLGLNATDLFAQSVLVEIATDENNTPTVLAEITYETLHNKTLLPGYSDTNNADIDSSAKKLASYYETLINQKIIGIEDYFTEADGTRADFKEFFAENTDMFKPYEGISKVEADFAVRWGAYIVLFHSLSGKDISQVWRESIFCRRLECELSWAMNTFDAGRSLFARISGKLSGFSENSDIIAESNRLVHFKNQIATGRPLILYTEWIEEGQRSYPIFIYPRIEKSDNPIRIRFSSEGTEATKLASEVAENEFASVLKSFVNKAKNTTLNYSSPHNLNQFDNIKDVFSPDWISITQSTLFPFFERSNSSDPKKELENGIEVVSDNPNSYIYRISHWSEAIIVGSLKVSEKETFWFVNPTQAEQLSAIQVFLTTKTDKGLKLAVRPQDDSIQDLIRIMMAQQDYLFR